MILGSRVVISRALTADKSGVAAIARQCSNLGAVAFKFRRSSNCDMLAMTIPRDKEVAVRKLALSRGWDFEKQGSVKAY